MTRRPTVLVVDDEPQNVAVFARAFRRELDVRTAASGEAALAALDGGGVNVVITDYRMPSMDGLVLLTTVAARWPAILRIVVSGCLDGPLTTAERGGVAHAVIQKPWEKQEVLDVIARLDASRSAGDP